jgi:hypothetical protein
MKDLNSWKKDGLEWQKKEDGSLIESITTLKVKGIKVF